MFNDWENFETGTDGLESSRSVENRTLKRAAQARYFARLRREIAAEVLPRLPGPGEIWHIVSNGKFDYFNFLPVVIDHLGGRIEHFYGSTWTMSRPNVTDLLEMYDQDKIGEIAILTGTYFKRRETAVFATLLEGLRERGQRYIAFNNHTKIMLIHQADDHIVIEGSANFTANPRLENNTVSNDFALYQFHQQWMEEVLQDAR